jgi:hypothetical protein
MCVAHARPTTHKFPMAKYVTLMSVLLALPIACRQGTATQPSPATYEEPERCGGRSPHWYAPGEYHLDYIWNEISLASDGRLFWNGSPVDDATLRNYVAQGAKLNPQAAAKLVIAEHASCQRVAAVREEIDGALGCRKHSGGYLCIEYSEMDRRRESPPPG